MTTLCPCGTPTADAYVCQACMDRYHGQLATVPSVVRELELEHARLARKRPPGGLSGHAWAQTQTPYCEAASAAYSALRTALVTACRALTITDSDDLPDDTIDAITSWLVRYEDAIPLRPEGPDIVADLDAAMTHAWRVIDNPPERVLRGRCVCDTELRAPRTARLVRCPGCGTSWDGDMLDQLRDNAVRDHLATWSELEAYATKTLGIARRTVRSWRDRGRIASIGGRYRVGDLITLAQQHAS